MMDSETEAVVSKEGMAATVRAVTVSSMLTTRLTALLSVLIVRPRLSTTARGLIGSVSSSSSMTVRLRPSMGWQPRAATQRWTVVHVDDEARLTDDGAVVSVDCEAEVMLER